MNLSYYSPALEVLWKLLKTNHIDPSIVFSKYNLQFSDLKNTEHRVPLQIIPQLWDDAYELIESPSFGLDSYKYWHPSYMGALGYAWLSSATLRDGFLRLSRFIRILTNTGLITFEEDETEFTVILDHQQLGKKPARSDNALSIILHMCRMNYQETLNPSKITFSYSEPSCVSDYFSYFKSPVYFNKPLDSISFPVEVVDTILPGGNKQLAQLNDQVMIQALEELNSKEGHSKLEEQVTTIIIKQLPTGLVTGQMVADELAISYRSLQRKLTKSGTNFKTLFS
ncbi:MAG: AraC family transcriptional regulator [Gammaproteobacteria bacterium]|nr:AraC family transcriptional regulator [Gammaproteobacteria bacterium]